MNIPSRLNHRRRVVYAALRKALGRDQRIPKLFIFWDRTFASLDHFVISPYTEQAAGRGLLNDQEKRDLTRALMHYMSHDYHDLPEYPEEFINLKPKSASPGVAQAAVAQAVVARESHVTPVPSIREDQVISLPLQKAQAPLASLKMTLTPEMNPSYLVFREVMAVELRLLRDNGRNAEGVKALVLKTAQHLNLQELEPLLHIWSTHEFSLETLPVLSEQSSMQALIQLFYQAACEALGTPVELGYTRLTPVPLATSQVKTVKTEVPELIR
jgi:hypothetical protein